MAFLIAYDQETRAKQRPKDKYYEQVKAEAEADLVKFIRLVHPQTVLGKVHEELCHWMTREDAKRHQLILLPRDHQKSRMAAYYAAWEITRNPAIRILYISSTSNLATKQLKFIKDILTSETYQYYWPEMVNPEEGKREKWSETEIIVDHPLRKKEAVRDPTVFTAGLTTNITGLHCDLAILDDVVVQENAYTEEGRRKVLEQYSLLSSIESTDGREIVVGTRYHPEDLYYHLMERKVQQFDEDGNLISEEPLFETFIRQVESRGDGSGEYLWPRQQRSDGKWFGFNRNILEIKRAQYIDQRQFRAQYYNDPVDIASAKIKPEYFRYYNRDELVKDGGNVFYHGERLNVFAAIDFAASVSKNADYTALVTIGIDKDANIFVLDIDRYKTSRISDHYEHILQAMNKWPFLKLFAEAIGFQKVIVEDLLNNYIFRYGLVLNIERIEHHKQSKEDRMMAVLQPRYEQGRIFHYKEGNIQILEEELINPNPTHDDVMDALSIAVEHAIPPVGFSHFKKNTNTTFDYESMGLVPNSRFGGI